MPPDDPTLPRPDRDVAARRVALTLTQLSHRVPGGTATSVLDLARALIERRDVEVVVVGARGLTRRPPVLGSDVEVTVVDLPLPARILYDAWDRTGRPAVDSAVADSAVTDRAGAPDLVHLTVPMGPPRSAVPLVATVHDLFPLSRPEWFTRRGVRLMAPALMRIRDRADAVVVPSRSVADDCLAHGFDPDRLHVVPWGSRPVRLPADGAESVRRRHGLVGPYVLFVGTVEPRKGLPVLTDALARLGRPELTLVVAGPAGWGPALDGELGTVPGPVVRTGYLSDADLAALRAGASVCCLPSFAEGFGLPALEALAAGTPVVTTARTALAEVVGDAAVLVPAGRPDRLADALRRVLDDEDLAAALRAAGPERAATFSWERTAESTAEIYRAVTP